MKKCTAVVEHGQICFVIDQGEDGYEEFSEILDSISQNNAMSWYGDIVNADGKEQCGLKLAVRPNQSPPAQQKTKH